MSLWGVPIWAIIVITIFVAADTWWRIKTGRIGGPLSVLLSALARLAFCGWFLACARPHASYLRWALTWALFLLSWLVLDTWAERSRRHLVQKADPRAV